MKHIKFSCFFSVTSCSPQPSLWCSCPTVIITRSPSHTLRPPLSLHPPYLSPTLPPSPPTPSLSPPSPCLRGVGTYLELCGWKRVLCVLHKPLQGPFQQVVGTVAIPGLNICHHEIRKPIYMAGCPQDGLRCHCWTFHLQNTSGSIKVLNPNKTVV
jgi:hypothetical protein